jgi:hypothetical protein
VRRHQVLGSHILDVQSPVSEKVLQVSITAMTMRPYAKQPKNRQLEADALEICLRAERCVGEMMTTQQETVGLARWALHSERVLTSHVVSTLVVKRSRVYSAGLH